jgi:hypothetical protein
VSCILARAVRSPVAPQVLPTGTSACGGMQLQLRSTFFVLFHWLSESGREWIEYGNEGNEGMAHEKRGHEIERYSVRQNSRLPKKSCQRCSFHTGAPASASRLILIWYDMAVLD